MGPDGSSATADAMQALAARLTSEKSGAVAQLAAGIAHELRNPLAVILARVQLLKMSLRDGQMPDRARLEHAVNTIEQQALRSSKTIETLSAFARPRVPDLVPLDVAATVRTVLGVLRHAGDVGNGVEVRLDVARPLPALYADHDQLVTALTELVRNAVHAVGTAGAIRVTVTGDTSGVEVRVADTGVGVPAGDADRIFEPFFTTKPHAVGLGLSVARAIAEAHGGTLRLSALPDGQTTFVLRLPMTREGARA